MADIFISYAKKDRSRVEPLAKALEKLGWTVWWDPIIPTGKDFDDVIEEELSKARCVIVIWTKRSVKSKYVKGEAREALNRDILVPIEIESGIKPPFDFRSIQTLSLTNWDGSDNFPEFQKLIADVIGILGEPPVEEQKRKREQAKREAEQERRLKQEQERKLREAEQRKAEEERQRLEEEKQRLAEEKRKFEEEQKRLEAARKAEEERKQKEAEAKRKADEEKRRKEQEELKRISEEKERKRKDAEAKRKTEEEQKRRKFKAEIKPDKPEPDAIAASESRKTNNALKLDAVAGVIVLLIAGIWWYISNQQKSFTNSIGMKFMLIPAGNFDMGSPPDEAGRDDDEKQHEVNISKLFYLQTTEVSQRQWKRVMGDNPSRFKNCGDDCPVERVSWDDAQKFIRKLNQIEGTNKYRLPTEAEWEYACRAGIATTTILSTATSASVFELPGIFDYN